MARRTFDVIDITEILIHWYAGRSQYEIADSLAVDRKTIRKYLAPAIAEGLIPGGPPISERQWAAKVRGWFPERADLRLRQVTWKHIEPHHAYIKQQLEAKVTVATIHQRLRDEHGLAVSVASLRRYAQANLPEQAKAEQVVVLNPNPHVPGEQAQIDWGRLGTWTDPRTGKRHTVQAFVMVLCCSRHMFLRPVTRMDQSEWTRCHVEAFTFFGGVPARLVPDNLKTGVDKPDLYDPRLNRSYAELAVFYNTLIDPARAGKPRDKAQVERPIPYVRDSFWKGRDFSGLTLPQLQAAAAAWCIEVAGRRSCRPLGEPSRRGSSPRSRPNGCARCPRGSSSRPNGRPSPSTPTSTSGSARRCIPSRGSTSASSCTPGSRAAWCSSSIRAAASWSRPTR